jgi:hypothetical protein
MPDVVNYCFGLSEVKVQSINEIYSLQLEISVDDFI